MLNAQEQLPREKEGVIHFLKFTMFSISAGLIELGSFALFDVVTPWSYWPKYLIALTLSVLWNFTLNRKFTFKSAANVPKAMTLVFLYYLVFTPLSTWGGDYLESIQWHEYVILGLTMITNFVTEFLFQKFVVYHNNINTAIK